MCTCGDVGHVCVGNVCGALCEYVWGMCVGMCGSICKIVGCGEHVCEFGGMLGVGACVWLCVGVGIGGMQVSVYGCGGMFVGV